MKYRTLDTQESRDLRKQRKDARRNKRTEAISGEMHSQSVDLPINRAARRRFAKMLGVFHYKPDGWGSFNLGYVKKYGQLKPYVKPKKLGKMIIEKV